MGEAGGDLDLAEEALGADGRGELGAEDLHGDEAAVLGVAGEVDRRHAALAELPLDRIAGGEGGGDAVEEGRHAAVINPLLRGEARNVSRMIADCQEVSCRPRTSARS